MNFPATSALSIDDDDKPAAAIPVASTVMPTPTLGLPMDDDNGHPHLQLFPMITTLGHTVSDANASTRASEYAFPFSFSLLPITPRVMGVLITRRKPFVHTQHLKSSSKEDFLDLHVQELIRASCSAYMLSPL